MSHATVHRGNPYLNVQSIKSKKLQQHLALALDICFMDVDFKVCDRFSQLINFLQLAIGFAYMRQIAPSSTITTCERMQHELRDSFLQLIKY